MTRWFILLFIISFGAQAQTYTYNCFDEDLSSKPYTYWKFSIDGTTDQMSVSVAAISAYGADEEVEYKTVVGCEDVKYQFIDSYYIAMFECAQSGQMGNGSFPLANGVAGIISFPKLDSSSDLVKSRYSIRCSY